MSRISLRCRIFGHHPLRRWNEQRAGPPRYWQCIRCNVGDPECWRLGWTERAKNALRKLFR